MSRVIEIRTYQLLPETGERFHRLFAERSRPLLEKAGHDVVAFGRSLEDPDAWFLIRAYDDLEHRRASQDAFYGSAAWREGPREAMLSLIDRYQTVVVEADEAAIEALRGTRGGREPLPPAALA